MNFHYNIIEKTLQYLEENPKKQFSLNDVSEQIHLSSFHFQQIFKEWAGVSPEEYLQCLNVNHVKNILKNESENLLNIYSESSKTIHLHNLVIDIDKMTPCEYKNGGEKLSINYNLTECPFGNIFIASTQKGICSLFFCKDIIHGLTILQKQFPKAKYQQKTDSNQQNASSMFQDNWNNLNQVKLHLKGTDFQLKVWKSLLEIPQGKLSTYGNISKKINNPKAVRAVGTAIGNNPVSYLIPCHRVIQSSGKIGGYRWNPIRKKAIIGWEMAKMRQLA